MLGRLALGCFNGLSRRSIGLRSVHLAPNSGRTETLIYQDERPVSPPAADPRWVMLSTYLCLRDGVAGDAKTAAETTTSAGRSFRVSADLAAPPATSFLCYDDWEGGGLCSNVLLAAHGDSVLIRNVHRLHDHWRTSTHNCFVYRAGTAARAPSLSQLPTPTHLRDLMLLHQTTGLLRRSEDELLVVDSGTSRVVRPISTCSASGAPSGR
ncbi:hypothetical protein C2845_PM17G03270 [Panicum miliaceum]|uniref:DUF1618 domain-containing protein n=1 Tax=Panicum miliaceum TaxID=4540 RepID=A0A3L6Q4Q2_PANMI|nr:hypothetical protein C2845_PM17G03270 [Panicum miliaceum]